ncbi:hypothetical protein [Rhizobium lusitanum]|uniref:hypothetical protein n=1 Tax=Rhizobium lusitanum TaxID=293958 RepID=UPI003CCA1178
MPPEIIDFLEAVEVNSEDGIAIAGGQLRPGANGVKHASIRQLRQWIMTGDPVDISLGFKAAGNFVGHILDTERRINQPKKSGDIERCENLVEIVTLVIPKIVIEHLMGIEIYSQSIKDYERTAPNERFEPRAIILNARHSLPLSTRVGVMPRLRD